MSDNASKIVGLIFILLATLPINSDITLANGDGKNPATDFALFAAMKEKSAGDGMISSRFRSHYTGKKVDWIGHLAISNVIYESKLNGNSDWSYAIEPESGQRYGTVAKVYIDEKRQNPMLLRGDKVRLVGEITGFYGSTVFVKGEYVGQPKH